MIVRLDRRVIAAAAVLAAGVSPAVAQEKITLRLAESLPAGHVIHELVAKPFMELVTKATNGQVTFQHYPAEQLGKAKDMAQLTVAGVADVSYIVPSYSSEKYPLTAVAELPGIFDTECQGSLAFYKISHNGGILETKEFGPNQLAAAGDDRLAGLPDPACHQPRRQDRKGSGRPEDPHHRRGDGPDDALDRWRAGAHGRARDL